MVDMLFLVVISGSSLGSLSYPIWLFRLSGGGESVRLAPTRKKLALRSRLFATRFAVLNTLPFISLLFLN